MQGFLDLPATGGGARPGAGPGASRPAGGNAAVADFLQGSAPAAATGAIAGARAGNASQRTDARGDLAAGRAENRANVADNRQGRVAGRADRPAARVENRGDLRSSLADGRTERRTERQQQLGDRADGVRDQLREQFDDNHLFDDFWADHPHAYYHFNQNPVFWTWATFNAAAAFMPWNWGAPAYYDYGSGGSAPADDGTVYADEQTYSTPEYAAQAEELAASAPEEPAADTEWLPLGVFALSAEDSQAAPNMFLQLAVSKEGILAGTYQNKTTGQTESVEGMIDPKTQRAAWTITGKNTPIMETGLANLTMNETRALMHFADGQTQQWLMVRIEKPAADSQPAAASQPAAPTASP